MNRSPVFATLVIVPITTTFLYFVAVFSFGLAGDLAGRQSMYPARMFTLPVTTAALAGWPMLYGSSAMASLWLMTALVAPWPTGFDVPVIWPALLVAALLSWTQVLMWMPHGLPGLRVIVAVLWLGTVDAVVLLAINYKVAEPLMVAFLAPQLPLAYLVARVAVARARRGDVPDWRRQTAHPGRTAAFASKRANPFSSAEHAQTWFEWRRHGRSLPALVGILLPFELALLLIGGNDSPRLVLFTLLGVLLTPPFMAAFATATVSRANPHGGDSHGVMPFMATRPLSSPTLVAAKLKMALASTLAAWLLIAVAVPLALRLSGTATMVVERAGMLRDMVGTPRAVVIPLLMIAGLVVSTWKQLVQSVYIGLSGRAWFVRSRVLLTLLALIALGPTIQWIIENGDVQAGLWDALPWMLGALVTAKMSVAAWVVTRYVRSRVLSDRALLVGAACWSIAVLLLYCVLVWLVGTPLFPRYLLALVAILAMPLARLSAAPLALAWNRHR